MSASKATPGPWYVEVLMSAQGYGKRLIEMRRDELNSLGGYLPLGDKNADARLIAAAPELRDALRDATKRLAEAAAVISRMGCTCDAEDGHADDCVGENRAKECDPTIERARALLVRLDGEVTP